MLMTSGADCVDDASVVIDSWLLRVVVPVLSSAATWKYHVVELARPDADDVNVLVAMAVAVGVGSGVPIAQFGAFVAMTVVVTWPRTMSVRWVRIGEA